MVRLRTHTCPECDATNIEETDREYQDDGNQGYWEKTVVTYQCKFCGADFTITETTEWKIERIPVTFIPV